MKILILNWRDIKNPLSGGAEILTHEVAKRWVKKGHSVTQISSEFKNSKNEEVIDGVKIIRMGHPDIRFIFSSVHFKAFIHYFKDFRGKFDLVIDEIHGIPFFTPIYVKEKKIALICEVSAELWYEMFGPALGLIGRMIEIFYMRTIYKKMNFVTISDSTKKQLILEGIQEKKISVIPMGISAPKKIKKVKKERDPTIVFVGRLSKTKGIKDAIYALENIQYQIPNIKMWVIGRGEKNYVSSLKDLSARLKLTKKITFWDFVSEEKKFELMGRAHILVAPSVKEGWGLIVPEAGFVGTPSIVYNVPGLRDIVKNKINGLIVKKDPKYMAEATIELLQDKKLYGKLKTGAIEFSRKYSWDDSANAILKIIQKL